MGISGIVAEFNPLHNGHKFLIERAKEDGNIVVCVISGNFVQRGDTAIVPKFVRANMALSCGADIVVELPTPWAMSTAQNFAFGAVSQLLALGIDTLYFGSESANIDELKNIVEIINSKDFQEKINDGLKNNVTYAALRKKVVSEILGYDCKALSNPNDTLAVEYICAANKLGANINFVPVKRVGAGHNDGQSVNEFSNATLIRNAITNSDKSYIEKFVPKSCVPLLYSSPISNINRLDTAIISRLKLLKQEEFFNIPDLSEGLENLLYSKIRISNNYFELLEELKSKRYTLARIRRLVLSAFLGIDKKFFGTKPPYVRVLGFKNEALSNLILKDKKPIITRISQIKQLDNFAQEVFELENRINEIYVLSLDNPNLFINESEEKIIKK